MFTMIAPMRAVAYWTSTHSAQLTAQMPDPVALGDTARQQGATPARPPSAPNSRVRPAPPGRHVDQRLALRPARRPPGPGWRRSCRRAAAVPVPRRRGREDEVVIGSLSSRVLGGPIRCRPWPRAARSRRILPETVLGSSRELQAADALVGGQHRHGSARTAPSRCRGRAPSPPRARRTPSGTASRSGVRGGDDGRLRDRLVLQQRALQLEGRDLVVGRLEDVVGAADVGDVAVRVARADVAGAVVAAGHRLRRALRVAVVAGHQADRGRRRQVEGDLALARAGLAR